MSSKIKRSNKRLVHRYPATQICRGLNETKLHNMVVQCSGVYTVQCFMSYHIMIVTCGFHPMPIVISVIAHYDCDAWCWLSVCVQCLVICVYQRAFNALWIVSFSVRSMRCDLCLSACVQCVVNCVFQRAFNALWFVSFTVRSMCCDLCLSPCVQCVVICVFQRAFNALCHSTHLYGRRLVLEWADTAETVEDLRRKTADHFYDGRPHVSPLCICLKH